MNGERIILAVPLIILALSVGLAETYRGATIPATPPNAEMLQLLGYNYNRQLTQLSVTLWNRGENPVTLREVFYDEVKLSRGLIGMAVDHAVLAMNPSYAPKSVAPTNALVFAAADHWNMDVTGTGDSIIQSKGVATLYLGVTSTDAGTKHLLRIVAEAGRYVFTLEFRGE